MRGQTPAERVFEQYRNDLLALPDDNDLKRISLSILDSGIFWRGELKGKRSKNKIKQYETYIIEDLGGLIAKLVTAHLVHARYARLSPKQRRQHKFYTDMISRSKLNGYIRDVDRLFKEAIELGVANQSEIDQMREEIDKLNQDLINLDDKVRDAMKEREQRFPLSLAKIFNDYAKAPALRVRIWVKEVLKALGQKPRKQRHTQ